MAGGRGTRISSLAKDIPKPMLEIAGKPVLEHEIECLKNQGYKEIILTIGYLGDVIENYFGDGSKVSPVTGKSFGVLIEYYRETTPLGNAGALYKLIDKLSDDFFLLNGDVIFDIDFKRMEKYHLKHGKDATVLTHPNSHPYDSGIIITDNGKNIVEKWLSKEDEKPLYYKNRVNAGVHILKKSILQRRIEKERIDLDKDILKPLVGSGRLVAYDSTEYIKDMGTPDRFASVCADFEEGIARARNLAYKQKAIFLDRDGTINKYVGFLNNIDEFELLPGVCEAIKLINKSGYLAIVITNQPVIARGELTFSELHLIHNKMETLLGNNGAYIDGIYFCPHHPDYGYDGEIKELKIKCNCRKPNPGMIYEAENDFNLNLQECWMVGDSQNDIIAGKCAGTKTALIGNDNFDQDISGLSLIDVISSILK